MPDKDTAKGKGRVEEAAGALLGDRRLKNEGPGDQPAGSGKDAVDAVADTLTDRKEDKEEK